MLLTLVLTLIVLGVLAYLVETYIPMSPPIRVIVRVVIVLGVIWYLARFAGLI